MEEEFMVVFCGLFDGFECFLLNESDLLPYKDGLSEMGERRLSEMYPLGVGDFVGVVKEYF